MDLNEMLRERGLKKNWVAAQIGLSASWFSQILRGHANFPIDKVRPLSEVLKISVEDMVDVAVKLKEQTDE